MQVSAEASDGEEEPGESSGQGASTLRAYLRLSLLPGTVLRHGTSSLSSSPPCDLEIVTEDKLSSKKLRDIFPPLKLTQLVSG